MGKKIKTINESKAWSYVILAGLLEIVWASGFKYESIPSIIVLISLLTSFDLIINAAKYFQLVQYTQSLQELER